MGLGFSAQVFGYQALKQKHAHSDKKSKRGLESSERERAGEREGEERENKGQIGKGKERRGTKQTSKNLFF